MKVLFFCILSCPLLLADGIAESNKPDLSFFSHTFLEIDLTSKPRLQYLCQKNLDPLSLGFSYLKQKTNEVSNIGSSKDFNGTRKLFISNVTYLALEQHLLKLAENMVQNEHSHLSFLVDKDEDIAEFLVNFHNKQEKTIFQSRSETEPEPASLKSANQVLKRERKKDFDSTILVIIAGVVILVIAAILKSPSVIGRREEHKTRAVRKRWLSRLVAKGLIDSNIHRNLIRNIDDLPRWIRAKEFAHLDFPPTGADPELEVALRRRKRGESVVSTKETSLERTSR